MNKITKEVLSKFLAELILRGDKRINEVPPHLIENTIDMLHVSDKEREVDIDDFFVNSPNMESTD